MSTEVLLNEFKECSEHPYRVISAYKQEGKKVIGVLPYFAPVELVVAAGMVPMGIWGSNKKTIAQAKEYCATFYCTIAQLALEMLLDGTLPLTMGGGIGQSRLCMLLLGKAHVGEVQVSLWDDDTVAACEKAGIALL